MQNSTAPMNNSTEIDEIRRKLEQLSSKQDEVLQNLVFFTRNTVASSNATLEILTSRIQDSEKREASRVLVQQRRFSQIKETMVKFDPISLDSYLYRAIIIKKLGRYMMNEK